MERDIRNNERGIDRINNRIERLERSINSLNSDVLHFDRRFDYILRLIDIQDNYNRDFYRRRRSRSRSRNRSRSRSRSRIRNRSNSYSSSRTNNWNNWGRDRRISPRFSPRFRHSNSPPIFSDSSSSENDFIDENENNINESESFNSDLIPATNLEDITKLNDESKKCVICLEEFENNNLINTLPCAHIFHSECLKKWVSNKPSCPTCRLNLRDYY